MKWLSSYLLQLLDSRQHVTVGDVYARGVLCRTVMTRARVYVCVCVTNRQTGGGGQKKSFQMRQDRCQSKQSNPILERTKHAVSMFKRMKGKT